MNQQIARAYCKWCNKPLSPSHIGLCPYCGREGKNIQLTFHEAITLKDLLNWEKRRTYLEQHRIVDVISWIITFGSPFLGLWIDGWVGVFLGLFFGVVSFFLTPYLSSKVIEITKDRNCSLS